MNGFDLLLKESRVLVCAGSGGVGKTTISAALALRGAELGLRVYVLTVDPAKRLATALGLDLSKETEKQVSLTNAPGTLTAAVLNSKQIFDDFILKHSERAEIVSRIMKNRLYQQLSTTLSGSQEFTALEKLVQATESGKYDLVILDTPPTKHAMDFLTAPQRINSLFQDSITKWFLAPGDESPGFIKGLIGRGTRKVLKSLEVLTGGPFIEELIDFFSAMRSLQTVLRTRSEAAHQLLLNKLTRFVVVTSFDAAKLTEAQYLQGELERLGYHLRGAVINRAFPLGLPDELNEQSVVGDASAHQRVLDFYKRFKDYYAHRYNLYEQFSKSLEQKGVVVVRIPEYQRDIFGISDLELLAKRL